MWTDSLNWTGGTMQEIKKNVQPTRRLKTCWSLDLQLTLGDVAGWNSVQRHHTNTWYRSVLCIIITLGYTLYSF
jgi:hypothetical protein